MCGRVVVVWSSPAKHVVDVPDRAWGSCAARRQDEVGTRGWDRHRACARRRTRGAYGAVQCRIPRLPNKGGKSSHTGDERRYARSALQRVHGRPHDGVVSPGPSVPSRGMGGFILGTASHLDAFSGYPCRSSLPGVAPGGTAGTRADRPTRSSRTRVRTPQPSNAHDGYRPNCLTTF